MITSKTIKYTKKNQTMAFITVEDLLGTVEGLSFSRRAMRKASSICRRTAKVFVRGRVSEEDDNASVSDLCEGDSV